MLIVGHTRAIPRGDKVGAFHILKRILKFESASSFRIEMVMMLVLKHVGVTF